MTDLIRWQWSENKHRVIAKQSMYATLNPLLSTITIIITMIMKKNCQNVQHSKGGNVDQSLQTLNITSNFTGWRFNLQNKQKNFLIKQHFSAYIHQAERNIIKIKGQDLN